MVGCVLLDLGGSSCLDLPPGDAAAGHGKGGKPAETGHHPAAIPSPLAVLRFGLIDAGLHEIAQLVADLLRPFCKPSLGALELGAGGQQGERSLQLAGLLPVLEVLLEFLSLDQEVPIFITGLHEMTQLVAELLRPFCKPSLGALELGAGGQQGERSLQLAGLLPVLEVLLESLSANQELPIFIQPAQQQRPLTQQCLMGHFQQAVAHLVHSADQQSGGHQTLQQRLGLGGQGVPSCCLAHIVALLEAHHRRHEGIAQGFHLLV